MLSSRFFVGLLASAVLTVPWNSPPARADSPPEAISFTGRVVEQGSETPVAGARVVFARTWQCVTGKETPSWVGETSLTSDAEGRFTITFPPDQVAEPRLLVTVSRVEHPDFVTRSGTSVSLVSLLQGRKLGDRPPFATIPIERGVEYSGKVVEPDGSPAAGVSFEFMSWATTNPPQNFQNHLRGRTDREGRFRLRMPRSTQLQIRLTPERFLPIWKMWGQGWNAAGQVVQVSVPTDLGTIPLRHGPRLSGRLLDLDGKPIVRQRVVAVGLYTRLTRTTITDEHGMFSFAPLRPGNYAVSIEGQPFSQAIDQTSPTLSASARVVRSAQVYFRSGEVPPRVELREVPSVELEVRFIDSAGRRGTGGMVTLNGILPVPKVAPKVEIVPDAMAERVARLLGRDALMAGGSPPPAAVEGTDENEQVFNLGWGCHLLPDEEGRARFRVPKGLLGSNLTVVSPNETVAYKLRAVETADWNYGGHLILGILDADRKGITVVAYRSPTTVVSVKTDEGQDALDAGMNAYALINKTRYNANWVAQADGRFRTQWMFPDQDYEFNGWLQGYVSNTAQHVKLAEGEVAEITLVVRKLPKPLAVGDFAPPFAVKTLDGQVLGLDDFRGKFLLLHFWYPHHQQSKLDAVELKAVHGRFGKDARFAMLSLSTFDDPEATAKSAKDDGLAWPQAVLRGQYMDPTFVAYAGGSGVPKTVLIDPEGKVFDVDLTGSTALDVVVKALGKN